MHHFGIASFHQSDKSDFITSYPDNSLQVDFLNGGLRPSPLQIPLHIFFQLSSEFFIWQISIRSIFNIRSIYWPSTFFFGLVVGVNGRDWDWYKCKCKCRCRCRRRHLCPVEWWNRVCIEMSANALNVARRFDIL